MERNSFTFNFESGRSLAAWLAILLLTMPGLCYWAGGERLTEALAPRWAASIEAQSQGRIVNGRDFLQHGQRDAARLATAIGGLWLTGLALRGLLEPRLPRVLLWIPLALYLFIAANLALALAGQTTLFWGALFAAHPNLKQAHFHFGRTLLADSARPLRGVVTGSSQGISEINAGLLNQRLAPHAEFANLSYAGSSAFDLLLMQRQFLPLRPQHVVCYLSERDFYNTCETGAGSFIPFLSPGGVRDLATLDPEARQRKTVVALGALAMALPSFRARRAIELALLGGEAGDAKAAHRASAVDPPSEQARLRQAAKHYRIDAAYRFQQESLRRFIARNGERGITTWLLLGQVSPALEQAIDPAVRADFRQFLASLDGGENGMVRVVSGSPRHAESDYLPGDEMHVVDAERQRFTEALADALAEGILDEGPR